MASPSGWDGDVEIDLQANPFLVELQSPSSPLAPLYARVAAAGGLVLIPPAALLPKTINATFAHHHVLLPIDTASSPLSPGAASRSRVGSLSAASAAADSSGVSRVSLWHNLHEQIVQITDGELFTPDAGSSEPRARIIFEELHYDDDFNSFHVLCVDDVMFGSSHPRRASRTTRAKNASGAHSAAYGAGGAARVASSATAHVTGSSCRADLRSLSDHRDVLTRSLGEDIATRCVFASQRLDFFLTDFALAWMKVVSKEPSRAAGHIQSACARAMQESIAALKEQKASAKLLASWPPALFAEIEMAIQAHVISCLHSKIFSSLIKVPSHRSSDESFSRCLAALGPVSLFDVGVSPHLVGLCDPRPAIEQMKLINTFATPVERMACLQKMESLLIESMTHSNQQREVARLARLEADKTGAQPNERAASLTSSPSTPTLHPLPVTILPSPTGTTAVVSPVQAAAPRSRATSVYRSRSMSHAMSHADGMPQVLSLGRSHTTHAVYVSAGTSIPSSAALQSPLQSLSLAHPSPSTSTSPLHLSNSGVSVAASILAASVHSHSNGIASSSPPATPVMTATGTPGTTATNGLHTAKTANSSHGTDTTTAHPSPLHASLHTPVARPRRRSSHPGPISISADDLLPLLVFVLLESRPAHLHACIEYMRHFSPQSSLMPSSVHSEMHYRLANLEAAVRYISSGQLQQQMQPAAQIDKAAKQNRIRAGSISVPPAHSVQVLLASDPADVCGPMRRRTSDAVTTASALAGALQRAQERRATRADATSTPHAPSTHAFGLSLDKVDAAAASLLSALDSSPIDLSPPFALDAEIDLDDDVFSRLPTRQRAPRSSDPYSSVDPLGSAAPLPPRPASPRGLFGTPIQGDPIVDGMKMDPTDDDTLFALSPIPLSADTIPTVVSAVDAPRPMPMPTPTPTPHSPRAIEATAHVRVAQSPLVQLRSSLDDDPLGAFALGKKRADAADHAAAAGRE